MLLLFLSKDGSEPLALPKAEASAKQNFCAVARKYRRVVSFLYGDGKTTYREKKKVLGLHGDTLPAMAMNTNDGRVLIYDEPDFTELQMEAWVRRYLGYDVAAQTKGAERRADSPKPPKPTDFGGEKLVGDAHADAFAEGVDNVTVLNTENFVDVVMNPHKDVLLVLQAHDSKDCQEFYKYVKRSADRFIELGIREMQVAKFDVERYVIPEVKQLIARELDERAHPGVRVPGKGTRRRLLECWQGCVCRAARCSGSGSKRSGGDGSNK